MCAKHEATYAQNMKFLLSSLWLRGPSTDDNARHLTFVPNEPTNTSHLQDSLVQITLVHYF